MIRFRRIASQWLGRRVIFSLPLGVLVFGSLFLAVSAAGVEATMSSSFCGSCHSMKQVYATWRASTHSQMACVTCHIEPGVAGFLHAKLVLGPRDIYHEVVDRPSPEDITALGLVFRDSQCERCHRGVLGINEKPADDLSEPVKKVGLKYAHKKHKDAKVRCMDCHLDAVHGTPRKYATMFPAEKQCLTCHGKKWKGGKPDPAGEGEVVSKRCGVCHISERIRKFIWENPEPREGFEDTMEEEFRELNPEDIGKGYALEF
jgi:nitrate/TMAO reductase-like tetraheme cytochrome c subunit